MGFDPKQPRNEDGEWVIMYHGTERSRVSGILKEGLKPSQSNYNGKVYLTTSKSFARKHAEIRAAVNETFPAVVRVSVPKAIASEFKKDHEAFAGAAARPSKLAFISTRPIPPDWIKYGKKK